MIHDSSAMRSTPARGPSATAVAVAGLTALAVAMGIALGGATGDPPGPAVADRSMSRIPGKK